MKVATVKLLKVNSKTNKKLLETTLPKSLKSVLQAGAEFRIQFVKRGKSSDYPSMVYDGELYTGLQEIKEGLAVMAAPAGRTPHDTDDVKHFQMAGLIEDDGDDEGERMTDNDIYKKMAAYQKKRGNRAEETDTQPREQEDVTPKKKKRNKSTKSTPKQPKSSKKAKRVIEQMDDGDIGNAFSGLRGKTEDDEYLENFFVNQQESPV